MRDNTFDNIISLGFSCHIAQNLDAMALRDHSYPFDWVISDMSTINILIETEYTNLFDIGKLYRDPEHTYIVKHKEYSIDFYHDFSESVSLHDQIQKVREKYRRRIERFNTVIKSGKRILFIRYLKDKKDSADEIAELNHFIGSMKKRTKLFKIIVISNDSGGWAPIQNEYVLRHFIVKPNTEYIFDPPLSDMSIRNFFRSEIHYNIKNLIKNQFFRLKVRVPQFFVKIVRKTGGKLGGTRYKI